MGTTINRGALAACAVAAGLLLAGCTSNGNLAGSSPASGTSSGSAPSGSASTGMPTSIDGLKLPTAFPSYSGNDPACRSAANAIGDLGPSLGAMTNESDAADTFGNLAQQAHSVASQSSSQDVTTAVNALGDDYQTVSDALRGGTTPNYLKLTADAVDVVKACAAAG